MGAILKKSVDWSDTDTLLPGESIGKAIVCFKSQKFWAMKQYRCFYAQNLNWKNDCIVLNPRIFKGEAIKSTFRQKNWIGKSIVSFETPELKIWIDDVIVSLQTPESFSNEAMALECMNTVFLWGEGRGDSQISAFLKAREFFPF